ncbi:MAG: hypothetical protein IK040_03500 [Spirochaetia bacterium]|nr:hypothetical protein [Spirochaetia bacterium]MBR4796746.1 hypothetical protein [Spirochaetia bacterium]MBR5016750.1 hypothetical protein [Spirochaetia bacterium]
MKRFALLFIVAIALCILFGCDGSSDGSSLKVGAFEGGYYHTTSSDGFRLDFKDGKCAIYYSPDLTTERCIGESPFSESTDPNGRKKLTLDNSIEGQSYFIVINEGNNLKNNKDWEYTKFPSEGFNWLNP